MVGRPVGLPGRPNDQARVVFQYAKGFVESGPLFELLEVGRHEIRNPANGGVLRTVSADGFVAHGLNPSACVVDELHAWNTNKQHELFDALDTAVHKRPGAFWLVITTAGHDRLSLLGRIYTSMLETLELDEKPGLVVGRDEFNGVLMYWYGAAEDANVDDRKLWRAANPATFVTTDALRKQRNSPSMSRSTFARLHLNAWVASDLDRWIATEAWDRLAGTLEIPDGATVFVGADGSRAYDTTCVAWAAKGPDGRIDVDCRVFSVRDDVPHHVFHAGGTIDFADVEGFLLELASRYDLREVRFDPRFLERSMEVLAARLQVQRWRQSSPTRTRTGRRWRRWRAPYSRGHCATAATRRPHNRFSPPLPTGSTTETCAGCASWIARARSTRR
jgi:phage terminase large subunit-like protein